jgi:hypothetical protein
MSDSGLSLYSDILYHFPLGADQVGYFLALCEHQSTPDKQMPLRLIKYSIATIEGDLKQRHEHFPVVVNTVFCTRKEPWNYSTAFNGCYADAKLGSSYLSMAPFRLVELPADSKRSTYRGPTLNFCWATFYSGRRSDAYQTSEKFRQLPIFQQYFNGVPATERELVGRYLEWCVDRFRYNLEKIVNLIVRDDQKKGYLCVP